ncbi:MAG: ABC transporter permease [Coriobacteriales bacterium]
MGRGLAFSLRYAARELKGRPGRTLLSAGVVALALAGALVTDALADWVVRARSQALAPVTSLGVELVVSTSALSQAGGVVVSVDPAALAPGREFVQDCLMESPPLIERDAIEALTGRSDVRDARGMLLLELSRLQGVAPERLVSREVRIAPLTADERAAIDRAIRSDPRYLELESRFFALRSAIAQGGATKAQRAEAEKVGQEMIEKEFAHYPKRFKEFPAEVLTPQPITARENRLALLGADLPAEGVLVEEDVKEGRLPSAETSELVLTEAAARTLRASVGQKIVLRGTEFVVTGIAAPRPGLVGADVYMPLRTLQEWSGNQGVNVLALEVAGADKVEAVRKAASAVVKDAKVFEPGDVSADLTGVLGATEATVRRMGSMLKVVLLVMGVAVCMVTAFFTFTAREVEMATLRAIGWPKWRVSAQAALELALAGALGAGVGVAVSAACLSALRLWKLDVPAAVEGALTASNTAVLFAPRLDAALAVALAGVAVLVVSATGLGLARLAWGKPAASVINKGVVE